MTNPISNAAHATTRCPSYTYIWALVHTNGFSDGFEEKKFTFYEYRIPYQQRLTYNTNHGKKGQSINYNSNLHVSGNKLISFSWIPTGNGLCTFEHIFEFIIIIFACPRKSFSSIFQMPNVLIFRYTDYHTPTRASTHTHTQLMGFGYTWFMANICKI